jgi:hypothetical protein
MFGKFLAKVFSGRFSSIFDIKKIKDNKINNVG